MMGDMKDVHDTILYLEDEPLKARNLGYLVHVVKVPIDMGFMDKYPGDLFFIRFEEILTVFHLLRMDKNLAHLVSLSMAHDIIVENIPRVAIMDPFYMDEFIIGNPGNQLIVSKYIEDFMVANKNKECFLMPYFPE
jgi:hypothetical protein